MKVKEFIKQFENNIKFKKNIMNNLDTFVEECKEKRTFKDYEGLKSMYNQSRRNSINMKKKLKTPNNQRFKK